MQLFQFLKWGKCMYLLVCSYHRKEYSIMILKENLIEWKVSCLCLFAECLSQSPGSHICCGKEWEAKCQCEWPLVRGPVRERCYVMCMRYRQTIQPSVNKRPARNTQTWPQEPSIMVIWWERLGMINSPHISAGSSLLSQSAFYFHNQVTWAEREPRVESCSELYFPGFLQNMQSEMFKQLTIICSQTLPF